MKAFLRVFAIALAIVSVNAIAQSSNLPEQARGHIPWDKIPPKAILKIVEHFPHVSPDPDSEIIYGTDDNDIIDVTDSIYDRLVLVDPLDGNDVVLMNRNQNVFTRPGSDVVIGVLNDESDAPGYGAWDSPAPIYVNLETGIAEDGFGYTDRLTDIRTVHLKGGTVIGTSADENIFSFDGGNKSLHMEGGTDVIYYFLNSVANFTIEIVGTTVLVTHNSDGSVDTITRAEFLSFDDITYEIVY